MHVLSKDTKVSRWRDNVGRALGALRRRLRLRTRIKGAIVSMWVNRVGFRPLHNLVLDLRFGGLCGGETANPFADQGAHGIVSSDYSVLTKLYRRNRIEIRESDVLVDIGCGKGRVINWWLSRGMRNRIVGLELVAPVAVETAKRLRKHSNVEIISGNVGDGIPADGTFFYLFNPFEEPLVQLFKERVMTSANRLEEVRILYYNCNFIEVFERDRRWKIEPLVTGEIEPAALISFVGEGANGTNA